MTTITRYIDLKALSVLEISGTQSTEFLQDQLSCDIREVTPTQSRLGVHCNAKGRVLATFRVFYRAPHYYLLLPYSIVSLLLKDLNKYAPFYKVTLEDKSERFQKIGFMGPGILQDLSNYSSSFTLDKNEVYADNTTTLLSIPGIFPRAILLSSDATLSHNTFIPRAPFSYWETIDIKTGIVSVYPETRAIFTPHHLNYPKQGGISFTKGCYTGQEVIARMHYLGKLKQQLYQFDLDSAMSPTLGVDIVDAKCHTQGTLIMASSYFEDTSSIYKALGIIQNSAVTEKLYCGDILLHSVEKVKD